MADVETTVSPVPLVLVRSGLKLIDASKGVYHDTSTSISGAVGTLDFSGEPILRLTVTGALTGAFGATPANIPALNADGQSIVLSVAFIQDGTGGHNIPLETLFGNFTDLAGSAIVDETANGITVVDIVARRSSGTVSYTVDFAPTFDASQVNTGTIEAARLPVATSVAAGVTTLAPGSGSAASGNHAHLIPLVSRVTARMSDGSALTNGDYNLLDMPTGGTVLRLTGLRLLPSTGGGTATVTAKISGTVVTGTGTSVTTTASTDADATAANVFVARQILQVNIAAIANAPTMLEGYMHYTLTTNAWTV